MNNGIKRNLTFEGPMSICIETRPHSETKTEFTFLNNGKMISCELSVMPTFHSISKSPITLDSNLSCKFEQTNNIDFLLEIYRIIKELFQFMCYRTNIYIDKIQIIGIDTSGKHNVIGELHILENDYSCSETDKIISRTLEYRLISSRLKDLVQLIADNKLYLRHIPETKKIQIELRLQDLF